MRPARAGGTVHLKAGPLPGREPAVKHCDRRQWVGLWGGLSAGLLLGAVPARALAQTVSQAPAPPRAPRLSATRLVIAVEQRPALAYLPLTVAQRLGYFETEGLDVEIRDMTEPGSAMKAVQAQTVHLVCGSFSQLLAASRVRAFLLQSRTPQIVVGVSRKALPHYREVADLAGRRIGVQTGHSTARAVVRRVLEQGGLDLSRVELVPQANPFAAVQAFRNGVIDAISFTDPVITQLELLGELRVVADTRTLRGSTEVFGGPMPSICLGAPIDFIAQFPRLCQAVSDAMVHALKWLQTAGVTDIIRVVPESHFQGDRALYLAAFERMRESWTPDGLMPSEGPLIALRAMAMGDDAALPDPQELQRSYTNDFARKSKARFRA